MLMIIGTFVSGWAGKIKGDIVGFGFIMGVVELIVECLTLYNIMSLS